MKYCDNLECLVERGFKYYQSSRPLIDDVINFFDWVQNHEYQKDMPVFESQETSFDDLENITPTSINGSSKFI